MVYCIQAVRKTPKRKGYNKMPKIVNLIGQRAGMLEIIAKAETKCTGGKTMYICKCDCGNTTPPIRGTNLTSVAGKPPKTTSCGCVKASIGEANITKILTANKKRFASEYTFADLKDRSENYPLRYDFAVMNDKNELQYLIEFDGQHHYENGVTGYGWNTMENHKGTKRRDEIKNEYAKQNRIPLLRIPYTERDKMTMEMLTPETSPYKI